VKFSEIDQASWPELQMYLDTCLIPVSGLTGVESPWEATEKVARTGQWLAPVEEAFLGRTVTMPAYHYDSSSREGIERLNQLCKLWRSNGFRYVIAVCGLPLALTNDLDVDLILQPTSQDEAADDDIIHKQITALWRQPSKYE